MASSWLKTTNHTVRQTTSSYLETAVEHVAKQWKQSIYKQKVSVFCWPSWFRWLNSNPFFWRTHQNSIFILNTLCAWGAVKAWLVRSIKFRRTEIAMFCASIATWRTSRRRKQKPRSVPSASSQLLANSLFLGASTCTQSTSAAPNVVALSLVAIATNTKVHKQHILYFIYTSLINISSHIGELYCLTHYELMLKKICARCQKPILGRGVNAVVRSTFFSQTNNTPKGFCSTL